MLTIDNIPATGAGPTRASTLTLLPPTPPVAESVVRPRSLPVSGDAATVGTSVLELVVGSQNIGISLDELAKLQRTPEEQLAIESPAKVEMDLVAELQVTFRIEELPWVDARPG